MGGCVIGVDEVRNSGIMESMKTSAAIGVGVYRKHARHSFGFLSGFLSAFGKRVQKFSHYIRYVFRPAKRLSSEGIKKLDEATADDDDPNSFSPVFTNVEDAAKWLNS